MSSSKQRGFSAVEVILVVVIIGLVGLVGYMFYFNQIEKPAQNQQASDNLTAPSIDSESDLDKATETLDKTDPEASSSEDSSQLDSEAADL